MKEYQCKCGAVNKVTLEPRGASVVSLYCTECGRWIKWVNKDEQKAVEHIIQQKCSVSELPEELTINGVTYVKKKGEQILPF